MPDHGLTHVALTITDLKRTLAFYEKYTEMRVVHQRTRSDGSGHIAWISDGTRPFAIVLLEVERVDPLLPFSHLGFACRSADEFEAHCRLATEEQVLTEGPHDSGPPVGKWALLRDPDGHTIELSYGQEVAMTVNDANLLP